MTGEESGTRSRLEWVSCPSCSTTFRVAVPAQYASMDIEALADEEDEGAVMEQLEEHYDSFQRIRCPSRSCLSDVFYLGLDRSQWPKSLGQETKAVCSLALSYPRKHCSCFGIAFMGSRC